MAQIKTPCSQAHNRCNDKKSPAIRYEQTPIPCSTGISKFYTGKIEGNNFEGDLTLVTPNVELLTVDTDYFEMLDAPLDECGGKLRVKGHSHITLNKDFKEQLDLLSRRGGLKTQIQDLYNTVDFKNFLSLYLTRLVQDGFLRPSDFGVNTQPPIINNTGLTCEQLVNCPIISQLLRRVGDLENRVRELEGRPILPPQPPVNNNYPILNNINISLEQGISNYNLGSSLNSAYNPNGDSNLKSFTIIGGNTANFRYNGQPVSTGMIYTNPNLLTFVGNTNSELTIQAQSNNNKNTNMATITIRFNQIADSFERCVRVSVSGNALNYNILRNTRVSGQVNGVTFVNSCSTSYSIPETVFINEDGLKVYIPTFTLNGKQTITKPVLVEGTYTGSKNNMNGTATINNTQLPIAINVSNPDTAPISNDVEIVKNNREDFELRASNLNWSDPESDPLEKIKFEGDVSSLFTNPERTTPYVAGTELDPGFVLYVKAPDQDSEQRVSFTYKVKAGGKWSN